MPALDSTDRLILEKLQKNARLTNKALAECVGLSASACFERVKRLEKSGIICGYRAVIDAVALGAGFNAWVEVSLENEAFSAIPQFRAHLNRAPVIVSAHQLAQPHEFLLHVLARSGAAWSEFLTQVSGAGFSLAVARVAVVTDCVKQPMFYVPQSDTRHAV